MFNDFLTKLKHGAGRAVDAVGSTLNLPELGVSEKLGITSQGNVLGDQSNPYAQFITDNKPSALKLDGGTGGYGTITTQDIPGGTGTVGLGGGTPSVDPVKAAIGDRVNQINQLYQSLYGDINKSVSDKGTQLGAQYDTQLGDLNKSYENSTGQLNQAYAARGLTNSDYLTSAQGQARDTYNTDLNNLNTTRTNNQAQLGQFAATQKAGLDAGKNSLANLDVNSITDYNTAMNLRNQLDQQISALNSQRAGLGTNQEYVNGLNSIQGATSQAGQKLAQQLQQLVTSSANQFAKEDSAKGLISSAQLTDKNAQDYWLNYFQNINKQAPVAAPTA